MYLVAGSKLKLEAGGFKVEMNIQIILEYLELREYQIGLSPRGNSSKFFLWVELIPVLSL